MLWDTVVGHSEIVESLREAVERDRLNHAYLFTGPSAVGKFIVARVLAASVLCPRNGCGECNVCRRAMEEKHPDVTVIRPAGKNIPVETIRGLRMSAFQKPSESERKVYIVKNAERMWEEGASTLLKVLEEPPGEVMFILVTANPAGLLPTIRSRCQEVPFSLIPFKELSDYLSEKKQVPGEKADLIVRLTGGVLGRALDWCDEPWRVTRRNNVIKVARALRRADLNHSLRMADELYRDIRGPVEELASIYQVKKDELADGSLDDGVLRSVGKELDAECRREQLKEEARGIKEVLSTLAWWYRDVLVIKEGGDPGILVNLDMEKEIRDEAEPVPSSKVVECIEVVEDGMKAVERNVSAQLNLESTLLGIQEVLYG